MTGDLRPMVSMVESAIATETEDCAVDSILSGIKFGRWKEQVEAVRRAYNGSGATKQSEALKKKLPAVMWSGRFSKRANTALVRHSGKLCGDIDSLGEKLEEVRQKLIGSDCVFAVWTSPSGRGLKTLFSVPADAARHGDSFRAAQQLVRERCGVALDEAAKDVARLCFVCYDPEIYVNRKAKQLEPLPQPEKTQRPISGNINLSERQRIAEELLGRIEWESETGGPLPCPGKHLHTTGDSERDCKIDLDKVPTVHCFHRHCRGILEGVNHELRSLVGKAEHHPEACELSEKSEKTPFISLNSQFLPFAQCDDYPEPLGPAAFHGLAGEIVRRIEPHTEADPAALLFQFLAAFGNLIGHDHHIVADGTRHYVNLYGVLVGQSSKGRKGTSWNHIANLMERVDPEWRRDRVTYGLSSGEGLIWAVRDPIEETKPIREKGRYTGEYETYIANHGEDDKRLFVIEAEFANVLKVMAREGNTLSPVIRSAWDSGDLKTMVKTSPAKATRAHISIVGHITRDELRRLLTQTESANGFANRFCWLAVKRSKCLAEGGAIHTVNFEDVIAELHSTVDFAKDFVEIVRDPEAKKIWCDVYPRLSEAQPGMSGAVIGRAEAQVMRLSAIYALLDKSRLIRPDHHHAAMAIWRYCEQSARWVFGTSTGDRNADKILIALRHAPNGMTKTEMSAEVFNRHAASAEIDEALRLLYGLNMAIYRSEVSGGAPIQRWFFTGETSDKSE